MIDHTGIGVANVAESARFYDAVWAHSACDAPRRCQRTRARTASGTASTIRFSGSIDSHPHSTRQDTAFVARSRDEVDAFHAVALRAGGRDNGAPGMREKQSTPIYYAAFVLDPDGNNIEVVFRGR